MTLRLHVFGAWLAEYDLCFLRVDSGPCADYEVRWFYSRQRQECTQFIYGGCEGNANRFESLDECNRLCINRRKKGT